MAKPFCFARMNPDVRPSTNPEIVYSLERRTALAANHAEAVLAHQRARHRLTALGAIEGRSVCRRQGLLQVIHLSIIAASLSGCLRLETKEPSIGEAYVAPATLQLREEIAPRARVTGTLIHGARVEILARHRRFAKVRAPGGASGPVIGWTDGRQLLSAKGMGIFREQTRLATAVQSQGSATAAEVVNVHITPHRGAPNVFQLAEGQRVLLAGRSTMPRANYVPPGEEERVPLGQNAAAVEAVRDDWSLVCLTDHRCGWVLTSMLMLELPDEVIQLAEGHRITAFFVLGNTVAPDGKQRPIYLWTTSAASPEQYQFDAFRVFVWNIARDRYESGHSERNLRGLHPVSTEGGKIKLVYGPAAADGPIELHSFELRGRKLHLVSKEPWQRPGDKREFAGPLADAPDPPAGVIARVTAWISSWRK